MIYLAGIDKDHLPVDGLCDLLTLNDFVGRDIGSYQVNHTTSPDIALGIVGLARRRDSDTCRRLRMDEFESIFSYRGDDADMSYVPAAASTAIEYQVALAYLLGLEQRAHLILRCRRWRQRQHRHHWQL